MTTPKISQAHLSEIKEQSRCDSVDLSARAKDTAAGLKAMRQAPDVRKAKVAEVLEKMQGGKFAVPSSQISGKILGTATGREDL